MNIKPNNIKAVFLSFCALLLITGAAAAQDKKQQNNAPSKEEAKALEKIEKATDVSSTFQASEEYLKKYPNGTKRKDVATHLVDQIAGLKDPAQKVQYGERFFNSFTDEKDIDEVIPYLIEGYVGTKKHDEAFQTAESYLPRHPDDVVVLTLLGVEGVNLARQQNPKFLKQGSDYSLKAIALIESDKKPEKVTDAGWTIFKTTNLALLYQSAGFVSMTSGNVADAKAKFQKASSIDPKDPNNYFLLMLISEDEYKATVKAYQASSPGKQRDDLLAKATGQLDGLIEYYARTVAMLELKNDPQSQGSAQRLREDLGTYYKYRHNNSLDGLQQLIDKYKTTP